VEITMAFQSHRTRFKGILAGIEQEKIIELDYQRENIKERLDYVNKKYSYVRKYYEEYTSEYYKVNVNTDDNLSSDINIFKAIERDGNYLLNSLDIPRDSQHKYNLLTQEEFDKKLKDEKKVDLFGEDLVDVLKPSFSNEFINMDLKITNKDLTEDSEMGEVLRDYDAIKYHLKDEMRKIKLKQGSYLNVNKAKKMLGTINCDMLDVKTSYKGITRPSTKLGDIGSAPDYDSIKYSNPAHIKAIISNVRFGEIEPDSMLSHLAYDIEKATKSLYENDKLDDLDMEIIDCINSGMTIRATGEELNRDKKAIQQRLDKICRRVSLYYTYLKIIENC